MQVLSSAAVVPRRNRISPAPNQFTHEMRRAQPFFFDAPSDAPHGEFPAGTEVVLMAHDGGEYCRVVDGQGLYVLTAYVGLRRLSRIAR
jgi:hypothetical protein